MNIAAGLPRLETIRGLGTADQQCLAEVHAVLAKHGMDARFGVTLLHRHFDLEHGERLVETIDEDTRTLTIRPVGSGELEAAEPSQWALTPDGPQPIAWCYTNLSAHRAPED